MADQLTTCGDGDCIAYTTFEHTNLDITPSSEPSTPSYGYADTTDPAPADLFDTVATVTATVTNTGTVTGAEVVQLYVTLPSLDSVPSTPKRQLRAFAKTKPLAPGESEVVSLGLRRKDVSYWDVARQEFVVPASPGGEGTEVAIGIGIMVGASSRDERLRDVLVL